MADVVGELSAEKGSYMRLNLTWKVPGFFDLRRKYWTSPEFRFADASWRVEMYPDVWIRSDPSISIYWYRLSSTVPEHVVSFTLGWMTSRGEERRLFDIEHCFKDNVRSPSVMVGSFKRSVLEERRDFLAPDGNLTFYWHMHTTASDSLDIRRTEAAGTRSIAPALSRDEELRKRLPSLEKLQSDYKKQLKSGAGSDVCLVVSGKEFRAHQWVLKARSPVFSAMFDHQMLEKASGEVIIDDLDPDSFPDFLEYVYAGCVDDLSVDNVFGLYAAAEKYDLQTLKSECLECIRRCLSVDCFCDVMILSLRYEEEELMDLAIDFFKKNLDKVIVTVKWQAFLNENGTAANELFIKALVPAEDQS